MILSRFYWEDLISGIPASLEMTNICGGLQRIFFYLFTVDCLCLIFNHFFLFLYGTCVSFLIQETSLGKLEWLKKTWILLFKLSSQHKWLSWNRDHIRSLEFLFYFFAFLWSLQESVICMYGYGLWHDLHLILVMQKSSLNKLLQNDHNLFWCRLVLNSIFFSFILTPLNIGLNLTLSPMNRIQKYLSCKGGCLASIGADQPAEVVDDAPEDMV